MPGSGKMPVSTAALRTSSTTFPMSMRASRLAEYSMVKCGMAGSLLRDRSSEVTAHRTIRTIVGLNCVALASLDRADEGACQHHLARFERKPDASDLVGEPGHAGGGVIEHAGGKPGFFQLAVAETQRADPAQIGIHRADRPAAEHDAGIRCIVGDGIEDCSRRSC